MDFPWWCAVDGVAQSRTWLKRLSSSSSSHQIVDFPEQREPQKRSLWVHAHPFFFQGTEDGPEKLSLERVLFSLKANSVIKVRNRAISKRCYLNYFSMSLKAWQATVHMAAQSWTWLKQLSMQTHSLWASPQLYIKDESEKKCDKTFWLSSGMGKTTL